MIKNSKDKRKETKVGENFAYSPEGVYAKIKGKWIKISNYMEVVKITKNIDGERPIVMAELKYKFGDKYEVTNIARDKYLNPTKLMGFQEVGLDVTESNKFKLTEYFREQECSRKVMNFHYKLGFDNINDTLVYKLSEAIGIESVYRGDYDIAPTGSKDKYLKMLEEEVYGNSKLEFIIMTSLSAVILAYIGSECGLESLVAHLVGNSSTGKSTALKLAISLFGSPNVNDKGLYGTYNATNNAILKKLGGLKGVPYAIDEISTSSSKCFTNFIYAVASGNDKDRLNKDSKLQEKSGWLTVIFSNGEKSILESSNKNAGLYVRILELANFSWTKNAENSEKINEAILENYGYIGLDFVKFVMAKGKDTVKKDFEESKKEVFECLQSEGVVDEMTKRRCSKFAPIVLTAKYYEKMMGVKLDIKGILDVVKMVEKDSVKNRNFDKSVIDHIKQYIKRYSNKFESANNIANLTENYGKITEKESYVEVQMDKISFEKMIKEGGYEDRGVVLRELKNSGYLDCEKDRYTRSRKSGQKYTQEFYVIKIAKN